MASTISLNINDDLLSRLRLQAAAHGCSIEDEAQHILLNALSAEPASPQLWVEAMRAGIVEGVDLDIPSRQSMREPPDFA